MYRGLADDISPPVAIEVPPAAVPVPLTSTAKSKPGKGASGATKRAAAAKGGAVNSSKVKTSSDEGRKRGKQDVSLALEVYISSEN